MASLSSLISGQSKERVNTFSVTMVHYSKLVPSENNNYSTDNIVELAMAILLSGGIKQNLLARKRAPDEYELIAGHRRRLAVKYLVEEMGLESYAMVPVHVEKDGDILSEIHLILVNCSIRERTDWEKMMEVARLTELVKALQTGTEEEQDRFRRLFGKEPSIGGRELRKVIAESLGLSETRVANLRHIDGNLIPDLKEKFQAGEIGVSVANEAARLPIEEQVALLKKVKIHLSDVKPKSVSDSDTKEINIRGSQNIIETTVTKSKSEFENEEKTGKGLQNQSDPASVATVATGKESEEAQETKELPKGAGENSSEQKKGQETVQAPPQGAKELDGNEAAAKVGALSAHGTHSLLVIAGCESKPCGSEGGYSCFSCARECNIRQKERCCVDAPLGAPYPCEMMNTVETMREAMGDKCPFVNLDLAYHRKGDHEPVPCCKECKERCEFRCGRILKETEAGWTEEIPDGLSGVPGPGEMKSYDRRILEKMIADAEYEMELLGEYWITDLPECYTRKIMEIQAYKNLMAEQDARGRKAEKLSKKMGEEQPELPILKNNDQRKEWLKNYKDWGLWYYDEHIDVNYYKFDFDNGSRLVVAEYLQRENNWSCDKYDLVYYHLIEKERKKYKSEKTFDEKYQHTPTSETELVECLKRIQQKRKG